MQVINLKEKFALFTDYYNPRIVGELNGQLIKAVKVKGYFIWHHHDLEDEMFLVTKGKLTMDFLDKTVDIHPGEFIIVPRGVEHRPRAEEETEMLLIEPAGTLNTGNTVNELTRDKLEKI
jgi:mannose-6-phosphate isomerase-like protein (cupin superfamily)